MWIDTLVWLLVGTLTLALALLIRFRSSKYYKKGIKLPSSKSLPFLGHMLEIATVPNESLSKIYDIMTRGDTNQDINALWAGPYIFAYIMNPEDVECLLKSTSFIKKSIVYDFTKPWLGDGLITTSGPNWHRKRKLITPCFHFNVLDKFLQVFNKKADVLQKKLEEELGKQSFNIEPLISLLSLDIIADTAMAVDLEAQTKTSRFSESIKKITECITIRLYKVWYYIQFLYDLTEYGKQEHEVNQYIQNFVRNVISLRKKDKGKNIESNVETNDEVFGIKKKINLLDMLLEQSSNFTEENIVDEVNTFIFAGHDTVSSAMSFALYAISQHPHIQDKIVEELDLICGDSHEKNLTSHDLQEMHYLERVIKESLRLYPPVTHIGRDIESDLHLPSGYVIPAGSNVIVFIYKIHRDPKYFENPDVFDPDRFLPENSVKRHPFAFIPFSAGPRNCIGFRFAILELKLVIAKILLQYRLLPAKGPKPNLASHLVLRSTNGVNIALERREHSKN